MKTLRITLRSRQTYFRDIELLIEDWGVVAQNADRADNESTARVRALTKEFVIAQMAHTTFGLAYHSLYLLFREEGLVAGKIVFARDSANQPVEPNHRCPESIISLSLIY